MAEFTKCIKPNPKLYYALGACTGLIIIATKGTWVSKLIVHYGSHNVSCCSILLIWKSPSLLNIFIEYEGCWHMLTWMVPVTLCVYEFHAGLANLLLYFPICLIKFIFLMHEGSICGYALNDLFSLLDYAFKYLLCLKHISLL